MDRARRWLTNRVWWQKVLLGVGIVAVAAVSFLPNGSGEPGGAGALAPQSTVTPTTVATTDPLPAATSGPQSTSPPTAPVPTTRADASRLPPDAEAAFLVAVVDGDTIRIQHGSGGNTERVRLIGIDAPELDDCYGDEATRVLEVLLEDFELYLTSDISDRDRFDRLLRYVWLEDGTLINEALVRSGAALAREFPPDVAHADTLADAESEARAAGVGVWDPAACPAGTGGSRA